MKNINWKVRMKNKRFWVAIVPAVLLLFQQIARVFGYDVEIAGIQDQLVGIVATVFSVLVILGIVEDQTTKGFKDSKKARNYQSPKDDDQYIA
ncbi:phage holin [Oceanobacillus oncorhynchi]|uniref:phage holin n=1 Tax=Oceanobacillus oncorhynchi TaxID=545501 RepID=UPI0034D4D3CD